MIKQGLELKQQQKLSPLQIQTIKLIELPIQELEQRIRTELEENPVLDDSPDPDKPEDVKDVSLDEITDEGDIPAYKTRVNNWGKDPRPEYNTFSVRQSFTQSLTDQLGYRNLTPEQYSVAQENCNILKLSFIFWSLFLQVYGAVPFELVNKTLLLIHKHEA